MSDRKEVPDTKADDASSTSTVPVVPLQGVTSYQTTGSTKQIVESGAGQGGVPELARGRDGGEVEDSKLDEKDTEIVAEDEREKKYLTGIKLALVFTSMLSSVWLIALDQTILAPALPVIASRFNALSELSWIASAYFLTQCAFLLLYGQILTLFDRRMTFMCAIVTFEVGSIICAAAPTVNVLIFGRAFSGCGAAGIFVAVLSIVAEVTRLEDRPKLLGLFGGVFAVSSIIGPLLGGVFTDHVSWRWCFWINLPFGAITVLGCLLILGPQPAPPMETNVVEYTERKIRRWTLGTVSLKPGSFLFKLCALDWLGTVVMLGTITCLVLALQWGGNQYAWSDPVIIGTFCAFGALVVILVVYEWKFSGPTGILPLRLFRDRTQIGASLEAFFLMFVLLVGTYYLPIFYESARGHSATKAGIDILPFMLGVVFSAGISGGLVSYFGYYWPFLVAAPAFICIGSGLLYTIKETSSNAQVAGYQILTAVGVGAVMQNTLIAVQADMKDERDLPQKTGLVTFSQLVGGTIGIAIGSTIFGNKLGSALKEFAPTAPYDLVKQSVESIKTLSPDIQPGVKHAYVLALNNVYIIGVAAGGMASLSALFIRNLSVKGKTMAPGGA